MENEALPDAPPEEAAAPISTGATGPPKLKLAPRGSTSAAESSTSTAASAGSAKSNPFGAAKPREVTLQAKGVDVIAEEAKVEAKLKAARPLRFTKAQQEEVDALQVERLQLLQLKHNLLRPNPYDEKQDARAVSFSTFVVKETFSVPSMRSNEAPSLVPTANKLSVLLTSRDCMLLLSCPNVRVSGGAGYGQSRAGGYGRGGSGEGGADGHSGGEAASDG